MQILDQGVVATQTCMYMFCLPHSGPATYAIYLHRICAICSCMVCCCRCSGLGMEWVAADQ